MCAIHTKDLSRLISPSTVQSQIRVTERDVGEVEECITNEEEDVAEEEGDGAEWEFDMAEGERRCGIARGRCDRRRREGGKGRI